MSTAMLLLDVGNSRLKWASVQAGQMRETGAVVHDGDPAAAIAALPVTTTDAVWVAHVTGVAHEEALSAALVRRYAQQPNFARSSARWGELRNAYVEPERLGVDRWLVMIAAWAGHRGAACVVDAGTALTIDNIDATGLHQGGIIAAGLQTQQRAVLGNTRFATRDMSVPHTGGLGFETEGCVRQGAMLACLGAIDRACAAAGPAARRLITGGDAAVLLPHLDAGWEHRPNLVLEGLHAVATDR